MLLFLALGLPSLFGWTNSSTGIKIRFAWDKLHFEEWYERIKSILHILYKIDFWRVGILSSIFGLESFLLDDLLTISKKFFLTLKAKMLLRQESIKMLWNFNKIMIQVCSRSNLSKDSLWVELNRGNINWNRRTMTYYYIDMFKWICTITIKKISFNFDTSNSKSSKAAGYRFRNKRTHAVTVMQKLLKLSENINFLKSKL